MSSDTGKAFSVDWGLKACNSSGRIDTKKGTSGAIPFAAPQEHQSVASTRISRWTKREASGVGMRWTTPRSPSRLPQAISAAPSGSSYSPHLRSSTSWYRAACTIGRGRGQFLQIDQPASVRVRGRQEGGRRPARAVGAVAPRNAAQIDGVQQQGADIDILAAGLRRDLLGDSDSLHSLGHPRPPPVGGLRPAAPRCWRVRSGAASNRRRWYRARSWHAPGWQVGWMSCGADGPLGRPALMLRQRLRARALAGRGGMRWQGMGAAWRDRGAADS